RPAAELSEPPLRSKIPFRAMSDPDVLGVDRAGLGLILHTSNQRPPIGEDREPPTLDVGDEDATGPTGGAERLQPTTQTFEVDQARVDRIKGDRVAAAQGRQHLGPADPQIFSLSRTPTGP